MRKNDSWATVWPYFIVLQTLEFGELFSLFLFFLLAVQETKFLKFYLHATKTTITKTKTKTNTEIFNYVCFFFLSLFSFFDVLAFRLKRDIKSRTSRAFQQYVKCFLWTSYMCLCLCLCLCVRKSLKIQTDWIYSCDLSYKFCIHFSRCKNGNLVPIIRRYTHAHK